MLPVLAKLRIEVFRTFPYLYAGTLEYEDKYLGVFSDAKDAFVAIAETDDGQTVGCATGSAITDHHTEFSRALINNGIDVSDIFYFSESVLLPQYRGRGIGHAFFDLRENHAREKGYKRTCFCAVDRPGNHPERPELYSPLDTFWLKRSYTRHEGMSAQFNWPEKPGGPDLPHEMNFWFHEL